MKTELIEITPKTDYYDNPAMSQSKLKDLKKSPKHFWVKHLDPNRTFQEETEAMKLGKAFHACLLEPQKFMSMYICAPIVDRRTKIGKETHERFLIENSNKIVITEEVMQMVKRMRDSLLSKRSSHVVLQNGQAEIEIYWQDDETGVQCKAKPDYYIPPSEAFPNGIIIDPKTTLDASPEEFSRSIYKFGYHNQAAWYCDAIKKIYNLVDDPVFINIPIEKEKPHECGFFAADEMMIKIGRKENRRLLNLYNECLSKGRWEGYPDKIDYIGLPPYIVNKFNFEENII